MKHTITIQRHRPWLRPALTVVAVAVLALGSWGLYRYSRVHAVSDYERTQVEVEQLRDERRQLTHELRASKGEVGDLKDQVVYEKRSSEIDVQACDSVRASLSSLQSEVSTLREQLAFYRGIVSPDLSRAGVRVYDLKLKRGTVAGSFLYEVVLIQSVRHDRRISGRIELALEGTSSGKPQTLNWSSVAVGDGKNLLFSFKYFEEFSGELRLPSGFKPLRVTARLVMDDDTPSIEDQFDWDKVMANQEKA